MNLYTQEQWFVAVPLLRFIWTEQGAAVSHEVRFQDVATAAILPEKPIIQIHFQTSCLEVQSNCGKEN